MAERSTVPYAMVVDDDALILMDACGILEDAGFRCHEAPDGDAAIQLLHQVWESVTLLFTDVDMPGNTDGFALAWYVSRHWSDIEIVVASGRVEPREGDLPAGATFIAKPFNKGIVMQHLAKKLPAGKKPDPLKRASF